MHKHTNIKLIICLLLYNMCSSLNGYSQQAVKSAAYKYELTIPRNFKLLPPDSGENVDADKSFYNDLTNVYLIITARKSLFTDIKNYLDCSKEGLEKDLQKDYGDTTLRLIDCRKSAYYSSQSIVVHFEMQANGGFDRCMMYFIHHKGREIQLAFMYQKNKAGDGLGSIDGIMQSLKLL
jgi:hypothetical protein